MKKFLSVKSLFVILLPLLFIAFATCGCKRKEPDITLKLEDFKTGTEYMYDGLEYGLSVFEFTKITPFNFERDEVKPNEPKKYDFFNILNKFVLDGESAAGAIEFQDDKFSTIRFDFLLHEDYQKWFDAQAQKLTELYGKETKKADNENYKFTSTVYSWETDATVLNLMLIKGEKTSCTIGAFAKPQK